MMPSFEKGEIIDVDLGQPPKEIVGHEQGYSRPCIVINSFNRLGLAIVVPLTSKKPEYALFSIVKLLKGSAGLPKDSFVLCHQIRTISIDRVISRRGKLEKKDFLKIRSVLIDILEI